MSSTQIRDRYCFEICKSKCCYTKRLEACPNLGSDHKCKIHHLWKDNWCNYQSDDIRTMPIMEIIRAGKLKKEIMDQCCYAHPELLEILGCH